MPYPIQRTAQSEALRLATSIERLWKEQLRDRYLMQECIGELGSPVLALWGNDDRLLDMSGVPVLKAQLKNPQVHV